MSIVEGIIGLHPGNRRSCLIIEMNADKERILLSIPDCGAVFEREISIVLPRQDSRVTIRAQSNSARNATSSVRSFSVTVPHIAPESCPPCPGSSTTTSGRSRGAAGLSAAAAGCVGAGSTDKADERDG